MSPGRLPQYFDQISEALDAVPRLRRFILDLAVRGKLVEQDPADEPASKLLKRIRVAKDRLVNDSVLKTPKPVASLDQTDCLFDLPESWQWVRLAEIGSVVGGGTPPSKDSAHFVEGGKGIAWLTPADLGGHEKLFISHGERDLTELGLAKSSAQLMPAGSVLFTSRAPIGYTAIAANQISTNQGFKSIVPFLMDMNLYIAVYFKAFATWIDGKAPGTTFKEVSGKIVACLPFPLPPLAEQHRIVAKVGELMALCDKLEAAQDKRERRRDRLVAATLHSLSNGDASTGSDAYSSFEDSARFYFNHLPRLTTRPEHIHQLRQTILTLAVRGKLVAQDPKDEPASALLQRIDLERERIAEVDRRAEADLQGLLANELCWGVPSTWRWRGVADLVLFIDYRGKTPAKSDSGIRLITAKNVRRGFVNLEPEEFVTEATYDAWMTRGLPRIGDILFTTEAPMGNAVVVRFHERFGLAQRVIDFRPYAGLDSDFLVLQLLSAPFQAILNKTATGLTAKGIKAAKLKRLPLAVPPLAEQHRIVKKVNELMALCDELEARLTTTATTRRQLLESTLHEALEGGVTQSG
jgi:type I restriction enzyme S subunit